MNEKTLKALNAKINELEQVNKAMHLLASKQQEDIIYLKSLLLRSQAIFNRMPDLPTEKKFDQLAQHRADLLHEIKEALATS